MVIDPIVAVVVVLVLGIALGFGGAAFADRNRKRNMNRVETDHREERAHQERLEQERQERLEAIRKEEAEAMEGARKRMAFTHEAIHQVQKEFKRNHDQLISSIHMQAKAGCDAEFQQRFGITRPPKAPNPENDPEVQDYLLQHYAELRDVALAESIDYLVEEEARKRLAAATEDDSQIDATAVDADDGATEEPREDTPDAEEQHDAPDAASSDDAPDAEEPQDDKPAEEAGEENDDSDDGANAAEEAAHQADAAEEPDSDDGSEATDDNEGDEHDTDGAEDEDDSALEAMKETVREEFDIDSVRTYLLAAISARYDDDQRPIDDLPWPAFTSISPRGFGELVLVEGAPVYAQDSYREFAWKKFHTGRRSEKPLRGEYSWPASHELGDNIPVESVPTPAGIFSVEGPEGTLVLSELLDCSWMRHSLVYQGALLEPDGQRSFFINLVGLRKGDELRLHFDGQDFLEEAEDGPYFLNAMGEVNGAYVGISASKPEAANLGEAPYELVERTPTGFVFRMTYDARRHDVDTYPQFLEVHLAWCQPPSPRPDRIIRHVAN